MASVFFERAMYHSRKKKKPFQVKRHFVTRCIERIGFPIDYDALKHEMDKGALTLSWKQSNTRTHWDVPTWLLPKGFGRKIVAVYDRTRHEFVTVLYKNPVAEDFLE